MPVRYCAEMRFSDHDLVQIVDAAMAEAARKSGPWLVCRPGCSQCCLGPFPINQLDVGRLKLGFEELKVSDPERAARVLARVRETVARISGDFPGNPSTGLLGEDEEAENRFFDLVDQEPCPVLDPEAQTCDLYASRPMTCRVFGPPVRTGAGAVGICELCFEGVPDEEVLACEVEVDPDDIESKLSEKLGSGRTIVAFALR